MESLDDLSPNNLRELGESWAALSYACRNSFLIDPTFKAYILTTQWADEYIVIEDCLADVTITEDSILKCGWLMGEIQRECSDEDDVDIE